MSSSCVFCRVLRGELAQEIVLEDDHVVGFLCEPPATSGHVLVVPRTHRQDIWDIEPDEAVAAMSAAHRLAAAMRDELGATGVNLRQNSGATAGQDVFHFHLHVVPRYEGDTVLPGCVWGMPPWQPPPGGEEERSRVAAAIRRGLSRT